MTVKFYALSILFQKWYEKRGGKGTHLNFMSTITKFQITKSDLAKYLTPTNFVPFENRGFQQSQNVFPNNLKANLIVIPHHKSKLPPISSNKPQKSHSLDLTKWPHGITCGERKTISIQKNRRQNISGEILSFFPVNHSQHKINFPFQ